MRRSDGSKSLGLGAVSRWTSNGSAGAGDMAITAAVANFPVEVTVDWIKPFKARNTHEFTTVPEGKQVPAAGDAQGSNLYMMKVMDVFVGVNG